MRRATQLLLSGLLLAQAPAFALTFPEWQATIFSSTELANASFSGPNADPDADGISNLAEYARGFDPKVSNSDSLGINVGPSALSYTFSQRLGTTDLLERVEESSDLSSWRWLTPNAASLSILSSNATTRTVSFLSPNAPAVPKKWFARVRSLLSANGTDSLLAPGQLTATLEEPFAVILGWNDNARVEEAFEIERQSGSGFGVIGEAPFDRTSYRDETVVGSTTYTYRVSAFQGSLLSAPSNEVSIALPLDTDGDGLSDAAELSRFGTDPTKADSDNDGMPDGWEVRYGLNPRSDLSGVSDATGDLDLDGLTNSVEFALGLNPTIKDSNNNGTADNLEDGDQDGMPNGWEQANGTNPATNDADEDPDNDGLANSEEQEAGTYPFNAYSDGDSLKDGDDGWALDEGLFTPRLGSVFYAVVDLGAAGFSAATALGDGGHVLGWLSAGGQGLWQNGQLVALPKITSPLNNEGHWRSVDKFGGVVGELVVDDGADFEEAAVFKYLNGAVQTVLEEYLSGLSGENQQSLFYDSINSSSGFIYVSVVQYSIPADNEMISRSGVIRWNGSTSTELPDFYTFRTQESGSTLTPDQPLTLYALQDSNDQGQVVGAASRISQSDGMVIHGPTVMSIIDENSIYEMIEGNGELSISEGPDALVAGYSYSGEGFTIWRKINGWTKVISQSSPSRISGYPISINSRGEVVGSMFAQRTRSGETLIRNGRVQALSELNNTHIITDGLKINETGVILAWGKPKNSPSTEDKPCVLIPCDLAVDANRDGTIRFAGNYQSDKTKPVDKTTKDKPFRFWVNDDNDGRPNSEEEAVGSGIPDYDDGVIQTARDLEDFSRLYLHVGGFYDDIKNGKIKIGVKWKDTGGTSPKIKVYKSTDTSGSDSYLKNDSAAFNQITGEDAETLGEVAGNAACVLDREGLWANYSETNPTLCLIFEGAGEGKGQLCVTIHDANGNEIGEGPGVWLDLKNIKKMYQRVDSATAHPWENVIFEPDLDEDKKEAVIFVHGWRMSPEGAGNYAETMYKRMWHRGFKGRFAAFHWDTWWHNSASWVPWVGDVIDVYLAHYNDSEFTAWQGAASGLKTFVNGLPFERKNLVAHSMGNIVAGEALRQGMAARNYVLMNAAVPAACYDEDEQRIKQTAQNIHRAGPLFFTMWDTQSPDSDLDPATRNLAYRGTFKGIGEHTTLINFYLPDDQATSFAWEINNDQTKPPLYQGDNGSASLCFNYEYHPNAQPSQKLIRFEVSALYPSYYLSSKPEAMAHACRTWGKAVGAFGPTLGAINGGSVNMKDTEFGTPRGFDTEHSAQFDRRIQQLKPFYDRLLDSLQVRRNNP